MIVYTAVIGGYDTLVAPAVRGTARWLVFTDDVDQPDPWIPLYVHDVDPHNVFGVDDRMTARLLKVQPFNLFPNSDIVIWHDGNVQLTDDPDDFVKYVEAEDVAFVNHPRHCLYDEADACARMGKDDPVVIEKQVLEYKTVWGCPAGLDVYATFLVVWKNTPAIRRLGNLWRDEILTHSCRDQISLPYCLWRSGISPAVIQGTHRSGDGYERRSHAAPYHTDDDQE